MFLTAGVAYACRAQLLTWLARNLIVEDPLQPADLIVVLNGEIETRPFYAADLARRGLAPRVVIARVEDSPAVQIGYWPNETDVAVRIMHDLGLPAERITVLTVPGGVTSTYDEACALRRYVEEHPVERVLLVTSAFHTRRSRWILRRELTGTPVALRVSAAPHWRFDASNWWQSERGLIMLATEYIKFAYYLVRYR
jgi:uncharacterized SAM-binding protein YcdF (DUF218 family)